ncbi:MAG: SpoIIE family protein phosphatase [Ignavibacteriales bacterium]|nr:SpoIIE family protein phosphatase [Ignavibacteriales bacterium]
MNIVNKSKCIINFLIILLILAIFTTNVFAQNKPVKFNRLTSSNGLSQNRVSSIVQDHDGFIWIGTEDGLNKYDGYNFEIFKRNPGDSLSLNDNQALAMHVAKDGTLWIGGSLTGLSKYNSTTKTFTRYNNDHSNPNSLAEDIIISFSEDTKSNLWIVTQDKGFDYMVVSDGKFIHMANMLPPDFKIPEDEITFIHQDKQNHLWVGTIGKVYYFKITYGETGVPQLKPEKIDNQILRTAALSIKEDNEGNIWIGTAGEGLLRFNYKDRVLRKIEPIADSYLINVLAILALETDDNGNIWIGGVPNRIAGSLTDRTFSGLLKLNIKTRELQKFQYDPKDEKSLSGNRVLSLLIDKTGVLWVGTNLSGVNVYDKSVIKFSLVNTGPDEFNIIKNPIRGFYLDSDNVLWIASQGGGLISYDRTRNKYEIFTNDKKRPNSISSDFVSCIYDDGKFLWIGTAGGLNRFDKNSKTFKRFYIEPSDPDSRLTTINYNIIEIEKFPGYLWFGTNGSGLVRFDKENETFKKYTYDPEDESSLSSRANFVRTVWYSKSRPEELWTGTTNGINILNLKTETFRYYNYDPKDSTSLSHPNVMNFYEDKNGYVWVATYGGGLNRFDPKTEKFLRFTQENSSLPNNGVYGSLPDEMGNLWISTNNGITKFSPNTFQFRNYSVDDGLQSEEFNGGAFYKAQNGEMFFGGIRGYNSFYPSEVTDNKFKPNLVITDLKIFNESVPVGENSPLKKQISKTNEIVLPYWQNDISFEYVALHYSNPPKNKYAFKLENYEDDWRYVGNIRIATYTNLDPGEYVFVVKGSNNDGLWNEEGKSIKLIIKPPWWKTNWAYASYLLLFLFGGFSFDRYQRFRIKNVEQRKAQLALLQAENERKTKELEEARQLQLSMLPKSLPQLPHLDIAVYMKTATEVGGDYYDFHVGMDGTLTVVIGDATGHGMKAGTMVTTTKSLFSSHAANPNILFTFQEITRCIKHMNMHMLSMCLSILKIQGNKLQLSAAGMPPALLYRSKTKTIEEIILKGMPLGAVQDFPYELRQTEIYPGDTLLLMSDGLPEMFNKDKEIFGYDRVIETYQKAADKFPEEIITELKNAGSDWSSTETPDDDITFVVIKIK